MSDEKRIKDFEAAVELLNDDWFAVDSPSQGTRKMQASMFQAGLQSQITANRDDIDLHSGQIATLQLGVGNLRNDVDALETKVGDATLQTTSPDLSGAINEHEGDINSIKSSLNDLFLIRRYSYNYTVASYSGVTITKENLGITSISGYTIGAINFYATGNNPIVPRTINYSGNDIVRLYNPTSASISSTFTISVLWIKSSFIGD